MLHERAVALHVRFAPKTLACCEGAPVFHHLKNPLEQLQLVKVDLLLHAGYKKPIEWGMCAKRSSNPVQLSVCDQTAQKAQNRRSTDAM